MSTDECQILEFLKANPEFFSAREISRRVGGKHRFQKDQAWAKPCLVHLTNGGHIEMNDMGHFRYTGEAEEKKKKVKPMVHVSPQIAELFAKSGKSHLLKAHTQPDDETNE